MARKKSKAGNELSNSNESISTLTKPPLFGLYDEEIVKSEDNEIYEEAKKSAGKLTDAGVMERRSVFQKVVHLLFSWLVLGVAGIAYHELSRNLHDNHALHPELASKPLLLGVQLSQKLSFGMIPTWAAYSLEGVLFGSLLPLIDHLRGKKTASTSSSSVMRAINAMLGVEFGIRKIEWSSSLQASGAWFLLNIILWMFFDGTLSMLLIGAAIGAGTCITCYQDVTEYSQLLYFMDFYFLGLLFFGKLGRYLHGH